MESHASFHDNNHNGSSGFDPETIKLAFAHVEELEAETIYIGGIFVTDGLLRPIEFRCTSPIRPTNLQHMLYGDELLPVISQELVLENCLKKLTSKPDLILCSDKVFLGARKSIDYPLLAIGKQTDIGSAASGESIKSTLLQSESGKFDPVMIHSHPDFTEDGDKWGDTLQGLFSTHDLLEPFNRTTNALKEFYSSKYKNV